MPGIMAGLKNCTGDAAIYLDIDLQDPPKVMSKMISFWIRDNYDVVFSTRRNRKDSVFMKTLSKVGYYILEKTTYINVSKDSGDFRLMNRESINILTNLKYKKFFVRALVPKIKLNQFNFKYNRKPRNSKDSGNKKFTNSKKPMNSNYKTKPKPKPKPKPAPKPKKVTGNVKQAEVAKPVVDDNIGNRIEPVQKKKPVRRAKNDPRSGNQ